MEHALLRSQREVHAMAELVRERQHVTPARGVVEQHIRVHRGNGRRAEGAAALGRAHGRVDAPLVEEAGHDRTELGRER
jgi:hypothetical protein